MGGRDSSTGGRDSSMGGGERGCEIRVAGTVAHAVGEVMRERFVVQWRLELQTTVLTVDHVDQAAVRALLVMLWDSGHDVLALTTVPRRGVENDCLS